MKNVQIEVLSGSKLLIEVNPGIVLGPSKSGKTTVIATTEGNAKIDLPNGKVIYIGLNVYKKGE